MRTEIKRKFVLATVFAIVLSTTADGGGGGMPGNACQRMGWGFGPGYHAAPSPKVWNGHFSQPSRCNQIASRQGTLYPTMLQAERLESTDMTQGWPVPTQVRYQTMENSDVVAIPESPPAPPAMVEAPILNPETQLEPTAACEIEDADLHSTDAWRARHPPAHLLDSVLFAAPRMTNTP